MMNLHPFVRQFMRIEWVWGLGIFLAAAAAFEPALFNHYVLDDDVQVKQLAVPRGWDGWARAAAAPWWPQDPHKHLWRPVTRLTILAQKAVNPRASEHYYAFNILLHGAVCVLLFALGRRIGLGMAGAGLGALLFAVHPIHAEVVHQIVGRAELLAVFWMLLGLLQVTKSGLRGVWPWIVQPIVFGLALGSKESAVIYPVLVGLALYGTNGTVGTQGKFKSLVMMGVLAGVLGLFLWGKFAVTGGLLEGREWTPPYENPLAHMPFLQRLPAVVGIFGYAATHLVWPLGLSPDYSAVSFPFDRGWGWGWSWAGLALLAVVAGLGLINALRGGRGWIIAAAGLAAYALTSNGPFTFGEAAAQRFWYWPSAPALLGLGWLLAGGLGRLAPERRRLGALGIGAVTVAFLSLAWGGAVAWRTPLNFTQATLACFPQNWRAHVDMAKYYFGMQSYEAGYAEASHAVAIYPNIALGWQWRGLNAIYLPDRPGQAEADFKHGLSLRTTASVLHRNYAYLLELQGRRNEAAAELEQYLKDPNAEDRGMLEQKITALKKESGVNR